METNLITVTNTPALISVNFDEIKKHLSSELEKYDVVVTSDTVKEAKKLATEINQTKGHIDTRRKEEVASASEPVKAFDAQMKDLIKLCEKGRQKLLDQVKVFEDETKSKAKELLEKYKAKTFDDLGVDEEYRTAQHEDLATLSALTAKGSLSKSATDEINRRAATDKAMQDRTEKRLLVLENQSYKAGLTSPLTRNHVATFIFAEDDKYQEELDRILAAEVTRQEETEKKLRETIAVETARDSVESEVVAPAPEKEEPATPVSTTEPASGMSFFTVSCNFEIEVDQRATEDIVKQKFMEKMKSAGFTTMVSVIVTKKP